MFNFYGIRVVLFLLAVFLIVFPVFSLDPDRNMGEYNLEVFSTQDGLPQSSVLSMVQSRDGYLWLATFEGLARFDGLTFRVYDKSNTPQMASNRIRCLLEDREGRLWCGTSRGLLLTEGGRFRNFMTRDGLDDDTINALLQDRDGNIWIGTTKGLNRFRGGKFTNYRREQGLEHTYIYSLAQGPDGAIWIGTSTGGVYRFLKGRFSSFPIKGFPENVDVRVLHCDRLGRMIVGTGGRGLAIVNGSDTRLYTTGEGLSGMDIRALFSDSHGTLWIGTNGKGLNRLIGEKLSSLNSSSLLLDKPIRSLIEDREGNLWIGTREGLSQMKEGKFVLYNKRHGLPVNSVRTVFHSPDGTIWLGTVNGGLVRFRDKQFTTYGSDAGLKSLHIWTIAGSDNGSLWVGTYGGGLHHFKNNRLLEVYNTRNGLAHNVIRALWAAPDNRIWVGTNGGGVDVIYRGKITNYSTKNGLSGNYVYAIAGDKNGDTWIGTFRGTINVYKAGTLEVYGEKDGLTGHAIWSIYPDKEGVVWIGTDGGGLFRFADNSFTRFTIKDGLYSDLAFQVVEDLQGNLWMNCNQGIYRVAKADLHRFSQGLISRIPCHSFGKSEGMNTECNGPAQPAGLCTDQGVLWFPTIRGAVVIDPENTPINDVIPPVVIEEMWDGNNLACSYGGEKFETLIIAPGKRRLDFKYTALCLTDPEQVTFQYKLEGFDEDWLDGGNRRSISYTNLSPGDYTFKVKAANNDGKWNHEGASLSFVLQPYFWQTWMFRVIGLIIFAFLSYWFIGFVKKHMKLIAFWEKKNYIGSYQLEEQIGIGGMGIVYRVRSLMDTTKTYALKAMKEEYLLDEVQKRRFKNESLLVDRIEHPNIVRVFERGEDNGKLYIVMEYLQGLTLAERYDIRNYPTLYQCIHIMNQVADVLDRLQSEGIIHRDLKPENIMLVNRNGDPDYVKLLDFGIARMQSFSHLTETGHVIGTLPYMPPEVVSDGTVSSMVDIYSLGVIGYEMLTRRKPFQAESPIAAIKQIINHTPELPSAINLDVPWQLDALIMKMMAKDPADRPSPRKVKIKLSEII